jgi:CheY-like chemotaxis protein
VGLAPAVKRMSKQAKILIVDDEPDLLFAYSRILESEGYEILKAAAGNECLRLAKQDQPDLILLDAMLPDMDGIEVCKRIKADAETAKIFVIMLSGMRISSDDQADGLEAGADGYLTKPVEKRFLIAQARAALRITQAEAALVDQQEKEMIALGQMATPSQAAISAQLFGSGTLQQTLPDIFAEMVERYCVLLDLALEERAYRVEHNVSEGFLFMVERLGFLKAGPRDVIDIHSAALKHKIADASPARAQAYVEEGRLTALELMGDLVSYYRNRSAGAHRGVARRKQEKTLSEGANS